VVRERWHYLAAVLDLKTRQVVGWRLGTRHTSELTHEALLDALSKHQELCAKMEIALNASNESSPWQNGFMERWFGGFKRELGNPAHYEDLAALHEAILINQIRKLLKSIKLPQEKLPGLVAEIEKNHASEQEHYTTTKQRLQKEYDDLDVELDGLFKDKKMFKNQHERFERMVKDIEKKQKDILEDLKDHSDGDKAFVIGASYLLDVCSRAVELFDAESTAKTLPNRLCTFERHIRRQKPAFYS
jgi:hypothetical protein